MIVTGAGDQLGGAKGLIVNSVVRHVRRAVPAFRLPQAVRFNRALALGSRIIRGCADLAGRRGVSSVYRWNDRGAEGRDVDAMLSCS